MRVLIDVATRPVEKNGLGLSHEEVLQEVTSIESLLTLLPDVPAIYTLWKDIVRDHKVQGRQGVRRTARGLHECLFDQGHPDFQ